MELKIIIVEDKEVDKKALEKNIVRVFNKYKSTPKKNLLKGINDIEIHYIKGTGKEKAESKFYVEADLLKELKEKINELKAGIDNTIGICLDLKLTENDEEFNTNEQHMPLTLAKDVIECIEDIKQKESIEINVCPVTSIPNFDELSTHILGEDVGCNYLSKESVVYACIDSEVLKLIYFLANDKMPEQNEIDQLFDYD